MSDWKRHIDAEGGSAELAVRNIITNLEMCLSPEQVAAINWHEGQSVSVAVMRLTDLHQSRVNAAKAEAVLAFAKWMQDCGASSCGPADAELFIENQGWLETPGQAERTPEPVRCGDVCGGEQCLLVAGHTGRHEAYGMFWEAERTKP